MSELKQSFKKAIRAFMHASDFIVSLYEGAHQIAEDFSDTLLVNNNETIVLFFEEFQSHWLPNLDAG